MKEWFSSPPPFFSTAIVHPILNPMMSSLLIGGDFTQFNGRGGESIYGEKFADEK